MRKKRGKYKRCGRLGYNARRRIWFGKKTKWEKNQRFQETTGRKRKPQSVNPTKGVRNEERLEGVMGKSSEKGKGRKNPRRMKDTYRNKRIRRTGRKRRYGRIPRERLQKQRRKQRERQKEAKNQMNRRHRKGEWRLRTKTRGSEEESKTRVTKYTKEKREESRFGGHERRVDVRRWRSGRVTSIQMGRDLVEHGKVEWRNEEGRSRGKVKWEGKRRKPGQGRKVEEETWKKRKEKGIRKYEKREEEGNGRKYERKGNQYREADYVSGRRRVHRKAKTGEIWRPKGRERTRRR